MQKNILDQWLYKYKPMPGDIIVDVGAGIGEEIIYFSRMVGPKGKVIAIEAHPETYSCLQKTIESNQLSNVTALNYAVSDVDGEVFISDEVSHIANSIIGTKSGVLVPARKLDSILSSFDLPRIDLLKMNIEGAEQLAIKGMYRIVQLTNNACISCHDFLSNSTSGISIKTKKQVTNYLEIHGFNTSSRTEHPHAWIRDYVYAEKRSSV